MRLQVTDRNQKAKTNCRNFKGLSLDGSQSPLRHGHVIAVNKRKLKRARMCKSKIIKDPSSRKWFQCSEWLFKQNSVVRSELNISVLILKWLHRSSIKTNAFRVDYALKVPLPVVPVAIVQEYSFHTKARQRWGRGGRGEGWGGWMDVYVA